MKEKIEAETQPLNGINRGILAMRLAKLLDWMDAIQEYYDESRHEEAVGSTGSLRVSRKRFHGEFSHRGQVYERNACCVLIASIKRRTSASSRN